LYLREREREGGESQGQKDKRGGGEERITDWLPFPPSLPSRVVSSSIPFSSQLSLHSSASDQQLSLPLGWNSLEEGVLTMETVEAEREDSSERGARSLGRGDEVNLGDNDGMSELPTDGQYVR
jgi:hypothetical protein